MNWVWQAFSSECESFPILSFTQGSIVLLPPFREPVYRRNISSIWRTVFPLSYWTTSSSWRTVWAITTNRKRHPMPTIVLLKWRSPTLKTRSSIENKKDCPERQQRPLQNGNREKAGSRLSVFGAAIRIRSFVKKDARESIEVLFLEVSD